MLSRRRHVQLHLGKDLARVRVGPVEAQPLGQIDGDPPVLARVARGRHGGAAHLHLPVGVGHGARSSRQRPRRAGSRRHSSPSRSGRCPAPPGDPAWPARRGHGPRPGPTSPGFRPGCTCALMLPSWTASMISITVRPFSALKSPLSQTSVKARRTPSSVTRLVVGQEHRDQARVGRALHVVLPAQRMQARCRGARPGRIISASEIRQRELSVPWICWLTCPCPRRSSPALAPANVAGDVAQRLGRDAADALPSSRA